MYRFLTLLLGLLFYSALFSQIDEKLLLADTGNFKTIHEVIYSLPKDSVPVSDNVLSDQQYIYNRLGYISKIISYKDDTVFSYTLFDRQGDTLLRSSHEYNSDGSLYLSIEYISDKKGHITKSIYDRGNQKAFDDERKEIDVEFDKFYSRLFTTIEFENDYKGNVLESVFKTENNSLYGRYTYKYDYQNKRTEAKYYNNKNKLSWRKKMKYNKDGFLEEVKLFQSNRIARLSEYQYTIDEKGNWTEKRESRELFPNFFAYDLNENNIITYRQIEYYDE